MLSFRISFVTIVTISVFCYPLPHPSVIWTNLCLSAPLWTTSSFADILQIFPSKVGIWAKVAGSFKPIEGQRVSYAVIFSGCYPKRRIFRFWLGGFGFSERRVLKGTQGEENSKQRCQRRKRPASFALKAVRWPSGQNGCRNLSKGVKCCLHLDFPQHFYSSAEGVNYRLHVLVL